MGTWGAICTSQVETLSEGLGFVTSGSFEDTQPLPQAVTLPHILRQRLAYVLVE